MQTDNLVETMTALIRRVLVTLCDYPDDLKIVCREKTRRLEWWVMPNINDVGRIIGKRGAQIKGLSEILAEIGFANGYEFILRVVECETGVRRPEIPRHPPGDDFSTDEHSQMLVMLLDTLFVGSFTLQDFLAPPVKVEVNREDNGGYLFVIEPGLPQCSERLMPAMGTKTPTALFMHLQNLMVAVGGRVGARYRLGVAIP